MKDSGNESRNRMCQRLSWRNRAMTDLREIRQPGAYQYVFGPYAEPVARVELGESVVIHTIDAFGDLLTSEDQRPSSVLGPYLNPQTGQIYVEGVEPGDTLVVRI